VRASGVYTHSETAINGRHVTAALDYRVYRV